MLAARAWAFPRSRARAPRYDRPTSPHHKADVGTNMVACFPSSVASHSVSSQSLRGGRPFMPSKGAVDRDDAEEKLVGDTVFTHWVGPPLRKFIYVANVKLARSEAQLGRVQTSVSHPFSASWTTFSENLSIRAFTAWCRRSTLRRRSSLCRRSSGNLRAVRHAVRGVQRADPDAVRGDQCADPDAVPYRLFAPRHPMSPASQLALRAPRPPQAQEVKKPLAAKFGICPVYSSLPPVKGRPTV
jgi:hypothetical protein